MFGCDPDRERAKGHARSEGYFWKSCPICGEYFSGREWQSYEGNISTIPIPGAPTQGQAICPDCTIAGCGYYTRGSLAWMIRNV